MDRDLDRALRETFGFPASGPGSGRPCAAALAGRDVLVVMPTGSGKSLCYQLPALMRDDLAIVVSPLVSLMQDQVRRCGRSRRAASRSSTPSRTRRTTARRSSARSRASCSLLYVAPERFSAPGFVDRIRDARVGHVRRRRGALRLAVGPRLPPRLLPPGRRRALRRGAAIVASTATATPQVADDIVRRLGLREPVRVATGFDRPNLSFAVVPCRTATDKRRRIAAALREPGALPAIVYAGTRAGAESLAVELSAEVGVEALAYHAGLPRAARAARRPASWRARRRSSWRPTPSAWASTRPTCGRSATRPFRGSVEAYYQEAGRGGRDGAPGALPAVRRGARQGPARVLHRARAGRRGRLRPASPPRCRCARRTAATTSTPPSWRGWRAATPSELRALVGHLARAGVIQPAPRRPDRVRGRLLEPFDGRARATCRTSAGDAEKARWRQYRAVWAFVEGDECRRTDDPAPLRRPFGPGAAGSVLRRLRPDAGARRSGARPRRGERTGTPAPGDLDAAIVDVVDTASPAVGRTRTVEILRGGRSKVIAKNSYDGLPGLRHVRPSDQGRGARARRRARRGREAALHRGPLPQARADMKLGVLASGAGTNLQAILDTVHGATASRSSPSPPTRPSAPALERARAAGIETAVFTADDHPDRAARDAAIAGWLAERGVELVVLAGYMQLLERRLPRALPRPGHQRPSRAAARVPRPGRDRAGARLRGEGVRGDGPLRRRGRGQRARSSSSAPIELPDATDVDEVHDLLRPIEHELLPEAIRLIARGAVTFDPANPRRVVIAR